MRMFYRGLPVLPGADLTLTYAHVDDIAEGHLLAADKGKVGESYILTGPSIPLNEMVDFWAHLIGRKPPSLRLAGRPLRKFAPVVGVVGSILPLPELFSEEAVGSLGASYMARSDKARTELGWTTRPLQIGLLETFDWIARTEPQQTSDQQEKKWAGYALLAAAVLFLLWFLGRKKK
jgi:dihydroflavonol-4-reductase